MIDENMEEKVEQYLRDNPPPAKAIQWVVATRDKKQFIGFSCSSLGPLDKANFYLSKENAEKKIKQLSRYRPDYPELVAVPITLVV